MNLESPLVRANLKVRLQDGTRLATDIYRPHVNRPTPAALLRTPYGKSSHLDEGIGWAQHGIAFVVQDVRGRYCSEGVWEPYVHERDDGAETLSWLAQQDWVNGQILLTGGSYGAFTAWAAAVHRHPAVRCVVSAVPAMGLHLANYSSSGVLRLLAFISWWMAHGDGRTGRPRLFEMMHRTVPSMLTHLPVTELSSLLWADLPTLNDVIDLEPDKVPDYAISDDELARLRIPTMHIGGWHDPFIGQTLHQWSVVGSAIAPRPERCLIIGPWTHALQFNQTASFGERHYGSSSRLPLGSVQVAWLRRVLGNDDATAAKNPVKVFLMGTNRWLDAEDWPPCKTTAVTWYTQEGGRLGTQPPSEGGADTFVYDPLDPYPGGSAAREQADLSARTDVVRYISEPLAEPISVVGQPVVSLYAATDAPSTDWVARLLEVSRDGRMHAVSQGLVDATREVARREEPMVIGNVYRYRIAMAPTAITLPIGHRLMLEITSSDFPDHCRNLNTGSDRYTISTTRVARQQIYRSVAGSTSLTLPVASGNGFHDA